MELTKIKPNLWRGVGECISEETLVDKNEAIYRPVAKPIKPPRSFFLIFTLLTMKQLNYNSQYIQIISN